MGNRMTKIHVYHAMLILFCCSTYGSLNAAYYTCSLSPTGASCGVGKYTKEYIGQIVCNKVLQENDEINIHCDADECEHLRIEYNDDCLKLVKCEPTSEHSIWTPLPTNGFYKCNANDDTNEHAPELTHPGRQ